MENASNYLNKSNSVSAVQYVHLRRFGYLSEEIEGISQEFFTLIKNALEADGLKSTAKPTTDLQERTLDLYSLNIDGSFTDDEARQIITNFLLSHPEEDPRFVNSFPSWLNKYKSKGTKYGVCNQKAAPALPTYKKVETKIVQQPKLTVVPDIKPQEVSEPVKHVREVHLDGPYFKQIKPILENHKGEFPLEIAR